MRVFFWDTVYNTNHWRRQLWGTRAHAPLDFQLIFLVTSEPHRLWYSTPCGCLSSKKIQANSFVTVYCMNFIIFLCVTLRLFSFSFMPLLAPNPGDTSDINRNVRGVVKVRLARSIENDLLPAADAVNPEPEISAFAAMDRWPPRQTHGGLSDQVNRQVPHSAGWSWTTPSIRYDTMISI